VFLCGQCRGVVLKSWKRGVSMWSVSRSSLEDTWGDPMSSVWESVKRGLVREKLKNLHCYKPLPGNGW
jgi:hypothetical protein